MNPAKRQAIFARLRSRDPEPGSELVYRSPFELLVAVILSAQATDKSVNLATPALFARADTPAKMLRLGEQRLAEYIRTIGLYRSKAKHIVAACRLLVERHQGEVPRTREALQALPGVGRRAGNVMQNAACCEPTIAMDTSIFRV